MRSIDLTDLSKQVSVLIRCAISNLVYYMLLDTLRALLHYRRTDNVDVS